MRQISRIKGHADIFRDEKNNAILFSPNQQDSSKKRLNFFKSQQEDINKLKEEISEIKSLLHEMLTQIKEEKGKK
jgi:hypothetical protein